MVVVVVVVLVVVVLVTVLVVVDAGAGVIIALVVIVVWRSLCGAAPSFPITHLAHGRIVPQHLYLFASRL